MHGAALTCPDWRCCTQREVAYCCLHVQLLSKQPGYHRPAPAAPPALPWQQGMPASQHNGWDLPPAPQYQQQQQYQGQQQQYQGQQQQMGQQPWQPAGYQPQGFAQQMPTDSVQQCCTAVLPMILKGIRQLMGKGS